MVVTRCRSAPPEQNSAGFAWLFVNNSLNPPRFAVLNEEWTRMSLHRGPREIAPLCVSVARAFQPEHLPLASDVPT